MALDSILKDRIRNPKGEALIKTASEAAMLVKNGMTIAMSGMTPSGYPKAVPLALAERANGGDKFQVDLFTGSSIGVEVDTEMAKAGIIKRRAPYQTDPVIRKEINEGRIQYIDMHLSVLPQYVKYGFVKKPDIAIIEAIAITEDGDLVLGTGVGGAPTYVDVADRVIVEIALAKPLTLEGMHDIYIPENPPHRKPINICHPGDRIGSPYVKCGWDKICAIVISEMEDKTRPLKEVSEDDRKISEYVIKFLECEVKAGRMSNSLLPLQSGVGSVGNAVFYGLIDSSFEGLTCYTEVIQDSMLDLLRSGKATVASASSVTPSPEAQVRFFEDIDFFKDKIVFRPVDISNCPEVIRRLGVIAINTAIEVDIYGNVNSTNFQGKRTMNGIGGSGDFSRNAAIAIFTTPSLAKGGVVSSIVPMCPHVDHTEHEVSVIVTEQGYADIRGLSPKERAEKIIEKCAHPDYKEMLWDYFRRSCQHQPCQTPHMLNEALSWHYRYEETGSMK